MLRILRNLLHFHRSHYWFHVDQYTCGTLPPGRMIIGGELIYATQDTYFVPPSWMSELAVQSLRVSAAKVNTRIFVHQKVFDCLDANPNWLPSLAIMHYIAYASGKSVNRIVISGDNRTVGGLLQIYVFEQGQLVDVLERKMTSASNQAIYMQDVESLINSLRSQYPGLEIHYCSSMQQDSAFDRFALYVGDAPFRNPFVGLFRHHASQSFWRRWVGVVLAAITAVTAYAGAYMVPQYLLSEEKVVYQQKMTQLLANNFSTTLLKKLQYQQAFLADQKTQQLFLPDAMRILASIHQMDEAAQVQQLTCYRQVNKNACQLKVLFPKSQDSALLQASVSLSELANKTGWMFTLQEQGNQLALLNQQPYWLLSVQGTAP